RYLEKIRAARKGGKHDYTDETWLNEVWQDLNITTRRQAFMEGFSTGLKAPSDKGRCLFITHIGSNTGFLANGLLVFESKKPGDYHEDMNADVFKKVCCGYGQRTLPFDLFDDNQLKIQLLETAKLHEEKYVKYTVDETAEVHGITVIRLPPYHCELNTIELIWTQVKGDVARKNTTFELKDVKVLFKEAIRGVTAESWQKCIGHSLKRSSDSETST
ncbi:hypothetical protein NQ318_003265, partial [Aromia moschata]